MRCTLAIRRCTGPRPGQPCRRPWGLIGLRLWPWSGDFVATSHGLCDVCLETQSRERDAAERAAAAAFDLVELERTSEEIRPPRLALRARLAHATGRRALAHALYARAGRLYCPVCAALAQPFPRIPAADESGTPRKITRRAGAAALVAAVERREREDRELPDHVARTW